MTNTPVVESAPSASGELSRVETVVSAGALLVYVLFHLWEQWAALGGRAAYMDRVSMTQSMPWVRGGVIAIVLGTHSVLALRRALRDRTSGGYSSIGMRRLQMITGLLLLAFMVSHAFHVWLPTARAASPVLGYDILMTDAGRLTWIVAYAGGIGALAFHLGIGLARVFAAAGGVMSKGAVGAAVVVALVIWIAAVNVTSRYVVGKAFFGERFSFQTSPPQASSDKDAKQP